MKPEITRENLRAWLTGLPEDKTFDYVDNYGCLIASWFKSLYPDKEVIVYPCDAEIGRKHFSFDSWLDEFSLAISGAKPITPKMALSALDRVK